MPGALPAAHTSDIGHREEQEVDPGGRPKTQGACAIERHLQMARFLAEGSHPPRGSQPQSVSAEVAKQGRP